MKKLTIDEIIKRDYVVDGIKVRAVVDGPDSMGCPDCIFGKRPGECNLTKYSPPICTEHDVMFHYEEVDE